MLKILSLCTGVALLLPNIVDAEIVTWEANGHSYELVVSSTSLNWSQANNLASEMGGYLATITSAEENAFLYSMVEDVANAWGGQAPWVGPFLGGTQIDGNWQWITGEQWDYENWTLNEPSGSGEYLAFNGDGSENPIGPGWGDMGADHNAFSFIVEWNEVPAPGALALLGLAGLRSRRRS